MSAKETLDEISDSLERTLFDAARGNELKIAYVRVLALFAVSGLGWLARYAPVEAIAVRATRSQLQFETAWCGWAVMLVLLLRGGIYERAFQFLVPLIDAIALLGFYFFGHVGADVTKSPLYALSFASAVLIAVGGLRYSRSASIWSTSLVIVVYVVIRLDHDPRGLAIAVILLLASGVASLGSAENVRQLARAEASRANLRRFLPAALVDASPERALRIISTPSAMNATILVSDLRGFTAMAETLSPAAVLDALNEIQGAFASVIRARGGIVDKFLGDGMLAVFGAPQELENHPAHAVKAARDMRVALAKVNVARTRRGESALAMGVGVHSGPVIAGCLGSGARLEFTVIGDTVNITSRLEALTKDKEVDILVSEETARRSGLKTESLGEVQIRGRQQPLRVHTIA